MEAAAFLKMDVFFAVTTVAVVLLTVFAGVALYYLARVLADIRDITKLLRREAHETAEDLDAVRADIKAGVHEVKERIVQSGDLMTKAKRVVTGAGVLRALSDLFDAFGNEAGGKQERHGRRGRKSDGA